MNPSTSHALGRSLSTSVENVTQRVKRKPTAFRRVLAALPYFLLILIGEPLRAADPDSWLQALGGESGGGALRVVALVTVLSVVPSIVLLATCFPRLLIVLSFLRRALGTQDLPPNMVVTGLAFILTAMVMLPVWKQVYRDAYVPLSQGEITDAEVIYERATKPLKEFMLVRTFRKDLRLFLELSESARSEEAEAVGGVTVAGPPAPVLSSQGAALTAETRAEDLSLFVVLPAFVLSELKTAFQMGFLLYLPFLVIDLAVSAILISMGMFMVPPVLISLPLKVLVFVSVDGWNLLVTQLVQSVLHGL